MSQLFQATHHDTEIADLVQRLPKVEEESFWRERLRGVSVQTVLANPRQSGSFSQKEFCRTQFQLPKQLSDSLARLEQKFELSRDTIYIAAWANLLGRYSGGQRALFGVRFLSLQSKPECVWPFLVSIDKGAVVSDWLRETQKYRDDVKKREAVSERDMRLWCEAPAGQVLIETMLDFTGERLATDPSQPVEVRFTQDGSSFEVANRTAWLSHDMARRLAEQFLYCIQEFAAAPTQRLLEVNIVPKQQLHQLLREWNATARQYRRYGGLQELFEEKTLEFTSRIAVDFPGQGRITYGELNQRANRLARHLQKLGIGPDVVVGICSERSVEMLIGVLAVIKAGGVYAPLDPTYPQERLSFMVEDTKAPVILTQSKFAQNLIKTGAQIFCLDTDWQQLRSEDSDNLQPQVNEDHLAYLIYTSGSTGKPKGVAMRQGPLVNLLLWQLENWSGPAAARTLQFASLNFDVSFQEIFSTWCSGGTLVLVSDEIRRDANALARYLRENQVERLFLPFVALKHLAEACEREKVYPSTLREVITAGEQLQITPQISSLFTKLPDCTLENQYGPSETHVVTAYRLSGKAADWPALPSIGKAIANTRVYLLDEQRRPVPIGVAGELYLGGVCVARGYLNRPELTAEKFMVDPFDPTSRVYKTGDLGRWLPDGNIEFLGRIDHQVKVRGFRVELGEIEAALSNHTGVREAVVIARDNEHGVKQLIAYVVSNNGPLAAADLRAFLTQRMPSYCVPSAFVTLPALPLTPNGKVDRKALPAPTETEEIVGEVKMPRDPLEMQLKLVFERFMGRRPIGIDVSFFELGGDSLQALKLIVEIERATGKKLQLNILYQAPTVEALADAIRKETSHSEFSSLVPLQPTGKRLPLFLIHTTPGDVLGYGNLVYHLDSAQPCYGFQSLGFEAPELSHTRIEDMAAHYVRQLRKIQPHGPYFLGGWCYGGVVAVEMAHQLRAAGEKVAPLLLIETPAPAPGFSNIYYWTRRVARLLCMHPKEWRTYLTAKYRYYKGRRTEDEMRFKRVDQEKAVTVDTKQIEETNRLLAKLEHVYHANMKAWQEYRPRFYPGKVVLFNAVEQDPAIIRDPKYGWPGLATKIETHFIPGNHDTILMEPHVRVLASKIKECLQREQD